MKPTFTPSRYLRYFTFLLFLGCSLNLSAQLSTGDIMFVAIATTEENGGVPNCGDGFAFVALVDIPANEVIHFTEDEYNGGFGPSEGDITWTNAASVLPAGTVVTVFTNAEPGTGCGTAFSASSGSVVYSGASGTWGLSSVSEEIYAYQGAVRAPTVWLSAIITDEANTDNTPPAALNGFVIQFPLTPLGGDYDAGVMNAGLGCSSKAACVAAIIDVANNWLLEDQVPANSSTIFPEQVPGDFTIAAACTDPTFNTGLSQNPAGPLCPTASVNILIDGDLGTNTEGWFLRTGSATGPVIQGPAVTTQFTISGIQETTTYFVTAAFCSGPGQIPASITITTNGTAAMAGPDQLNLAGPSEFLSGSDPSPGTGAWTEEAGDGNGTFGDATSPTSTFTGTPGVTYTLRWTVTNAPCATTMDDVLVSFAGGAPVLTPGDLAFTGFQSDGTDEFAFVLLTDVPNGTVINFTDNGWLSAGSFRTGEGVVSLTLNADLNCGTEIRYDGTNFLTAAGASAGTATNVTGSLGLSTSGDQLFAFLGSLASPDLIAGINFDGTGWAADATSTNTSALPAVLAGNNALTLNEVDNGKYNCSVRAGEPDDIRAGINDPANWNVANDLGDPAVVIAEACSFRCGVCVPAQLNSFGTSSTGTVCAGEAIPLSINGTLNDADRWVVTFGGTIVAESTTNSLTFIPEVSGNYVLTSIDGCPGPEASLTFFNVTVIGAQATITGDEIQKVAGTLQDLEGNTYDNGTAGVWAFVDNPDGLGVIDDPNAANTSLTGTPGQGYVVEYTITPAGCPVSSDTVTIVFQDPTPLGLGDIAFVGYNSDADDSGADGISFVILEDVNAGTTITFNENGWLAAGGFRGTTEGTVTVEFCGFYPCGSEFLLLNRGGEALFLDAAEEMAGTVMGSPLELSAGGDQVFAYQGATPTAGDMSGFLAAIQMNGDWDADATSTNESAQPQIFIDNPGTSVAISPEVDNAVFDCANAPTVVNAANSLAAINNAANWTSSNTVLSLPINCAELGCCDEAIITSVTSDVDNICPSASVVLTVDGDFGGGTEWVWYDICPSGAASTPTMLGMGTSITVTPSATTTYFVRAEGGCLDNEDCGEVTVTVDPVAPNAVCQDIEVFLDDNGMVTVDSNAIDNGSTDNCGIAEFSLTPNMFDCDDIEDNPTRALMTVIDNSGNLDTCSARVTVRDTVRPMITCQDVTIQLDSDGIAGFNIFASVPPAILTQSDNCGLQGGAFRSGPAIFTCAELGDNTIFIFKNDVNGNQTTCQITLTVDDTNFPCNEPPVAVCQPVTVNADGNCQGTAAAVEFDGGSTDPDGDMLSFSVSPESPYQLGTTDVTLTVMDPAGAMSQCTTTVMVLDTIKPDVVCLDIEVYLDEDGLGGYAELELFTATDNCAVDFTPFDQAFPVDCEDIGLIEVPLTVSDVNGNDTMCVATVTVLDTIKPDVVCLDIEVYLDGDGLGGYAQLELFTATDNCAVDFTPFDQAFPVDCEDIGLIEVPLTVSDVNGNDTMCVATVMVLDTIKPDVVCLDIEVYLDEDGLGGYAQLELFTATDNCAVDFTPFDQAFPVDCEDIGLIEVPLTVSDVNGNDTMCVATVMVLDTIKPDVVCLDIEVYLDEDGLGGYAELELFTATDNCAVDFTPFDQAFPVDCEDIGLIEVPLTVSDVNGNDTMCVATVMVLDTISPTLECPAELTIYLDDNGADTLRNNEWEFTEADNCTMNPTGPRAVGGPTSRQFDCDDIGEVLVREFFVRDDSGNESERCAINITVLDTVPPTLVCATDVTVYLDEMGFDTLRNNEFDFTEDDNCTMNPTGPRAVGGPTSRQFDCDDIGEALVREFFVRDDSGNESERCAINITVLDTVPPTLVCATDVTVYLDEMGADTLRNNEFDFTEDDNCTMNPTGPRAVGGPTSRQFDCDDIGEALVREFFVRDDSGNESERCAINITVLDTVPPTLVCATDVTVYLDELGADTLRNNEFDFTEDDNCTMNPTGPRAVGGPTSRQFDCDDIGEALVREFFVRDDSGNESERCAINITVLDTIPPVISCVSDTVYLDANGLVSTAPGDRVTIEEDNCPPMAMVGNPLAIFTCDQVGINEFTQTRTDESDNESLPCTFTITVLDTIRPVITVTPGMVTLDLQGNASLTVPDLAAATDACGIESITAEPLDYVCEDIGIVEVLITATDVNGNVATAITTVDVDFEQPNFACIGEINVTLDPTCSFELIPRQVLTGNTPCVDVFQWSITVMDSDTTNGPIIDGCGTFNYVIRSTGTGILALDFETCWGVVNAEDKTSPIAETTPNDVTLLCVDFAENNVSTLLNSVSKCYRVDAATGTIILDNPNGTSSMAPALRARLLAGGLTPLVPTFTDGCAQELEVCVSDAVVFGEDPDCDDIVLTRTFVASEISTCVSASGEENAPAVATYTITFERPTLADLTGDNIEAVVYVESCGSDPSVRPAPRTEDFPSLVVGERVFFLTSGAAICNIGVTYSDGPSIVTCPFTYKFVRTYTVIDWCDPSDVRTFPQVVKVGDTTAPDLVGPNVPTNANGDLVYGTNAGNFCAAYIRLDDISVSDNCSGSNVSISAEIFPGGNLAGAPIGAFAITPGGAPELTPAIPAGRHLLRYTSTDQCGNTSVDDFFFVVEDQTPPTAICEDGLNISVAGGANNGFAVLTPANIDNGSYDDCSDVSLSIARVNSSNLPIGTYGPQLTLTCADVGTVRVGLRVEDALGNVNFCWLDVLVEDKIAPTCIAPANLTISCTEYNTAIPANNILEVSDDILDQYFGAAVSVDNCNATITQSISGDVNSCGVGTFTRVFVATDGGGLTNANACTQRIDVIGIHDYQLVFPTDESGDCAEVPAYVGVGVNEGVCDLITTTTDIDTLRTQDAGDECFKLRITYDVVNWCEYNTLGEPYVVPRDGNGVNNRLRLPRNIDEDVLYVNVIPNNTAGTGDDQAFMTLFTDRALNTGAPQRDQEFVGYAGSDRRGFFRYTQFIKIYDEVAPEITFDELEECFAGNGDGCRTTVTLEFTALDECSDVSIGLELDANYTGSFVADNAAALGVGISIDNDGNGNYTVTATNVPVGDHALRVRAADGCGNFDVQVIEFCVVPEKSPTPICIQTLTVVLMDDGNGGGAAAIWAADFIASPIVDCFGNPVTKYSLFRSSDAGAAGFVPTFNPPATDGIADIDCDDAANGTVSVRVYAFDDNGTAPDYCEVVVEVQDNMGWCDDIGDEGNIAGLIADQDGVAIGNVSVTLTGSNAMDVTTTTDNAGLYRFTGLPLGADYTVQPRLNLPADLREIKSSDMVNMISVILGTGDFDSPYDYVAADVNRDQSLDIFDVVNVSQVILGQVDMFDGGETWVFVEAGATINVANPYATAFPEVYNANDLAGTISADFVAVEVGNPFDLAPRSTTSLNTTDVRLEAGQTHTVVLDGTELAAFQGTLELAASLELIGADYAGEGGMNLNRAAEGLIAVALRDNATVTLEVRATEAGLLSELISLTDAMTYREGVAVNGLSQGLDLVFNTATVPASAPNVLHQNTPNPVREETVIRFELATAGAATLTLRDAAGRVITVREIDAAAGLNTVELTNINASGVLTYTLTAGDFTATKKMVVVR